MVFKPGQSGNPLGRALERAKHRDPRSEDLQQFCKERKGDIRRVGEIALKKAVKDEEPWAIKLCMEYFYPKPGTFVAISKEESKEVNLNFVNALPYEDQQTFLKIWMKSKKGSSAFSEIENMTEKCIESVSTIDNAKDADFIDMNTNGRKAD